MYEIAGDEDYETLLGYQEIMGANDLSYLLGANPAAAAQAAAKASALKKAAQARAAGGAVVADQAPTKARNLPLGFDSVTDVTKATSARITSRPQVTFRPDRLVVAAAIAEFFLIDDLKIGKNSQLISGDSIPAEAFSNLSVDVGMKMDTANIGIDIVLTVSNIDADADHRFNGTLIGPAVE